MIQELNIGGSIVIAALEEACGAKKAKIQDLYKNLGDLGINIYAFLHSSASLLFIYFFPFLVMIG